MKRSERPLVRAMVNTSFFTWWSFATGCSLFSSGAEGEATRTGVAAGIGAVPEAIVEGVSALESGGWAAAAVVTALGLVKAGLKGWGAANKALKARRLGEIAEGLKQANGQPG